MITKSRDVPDKNLVKHFRMTFIDYMSFLALPATRMKWHAYLKLRTIQINSFVHVIMILTTFSAINSRPAFAMEESLLDFYRITDFSSIGILSKFVDEKQLKSLSKSDKVIILEPGLSTPNYLPRLPGYCLVANHIVGEAYPSEKGYYAFKVALIDEYSPNNEDVFYLYRNANAWKLRGSGIKTLNNMMRNPLPLPLFFKALETQSANQADQLFGYQWHAAPRGSKFNTWDDRRFWAPNPKFNDYSSAGFYNAIRVNVNPMNWFIKKPRSATTNLIAALIAYSSTSLIDSAPEEIISAKKAVAFCFKRHKAIAAYFQLFTPVGGRVSTEYLLILDSTSKRIIR